MKIVYDLLDNLKDRVRNNGITNTVTFGDIMEVDLGKTTIYPLTHFILEGVTFSEHIVTARVSVLCLDVVDENKLKGDFDDFYGNNDLQDVSNTQLHVVNDLQSHLRRGDLFKDTVQVIDDATAEPLQDKFENELAGWSVSFNIQMRNTDIDVC
jgi:hypothetical protein